MKNIKSHDKNYAKSISFYTPEEIISREYDSKILKNLFLTWTGCYIKAHGHIVKNRCLDDFVIIYCADGLGWLELNSKKWQIKKGDLFFCPPYINHSYGADEKNPWTKYWLHFRGESARAYIELLDLSIDSPILHIGEDATVLSYMQDIFNILKTGYTKNNLLLSTSFLSNILCHINNLHMEVSLLKSNDINIQKIIKYMIDNINENLSLNQLSKMSNISKYHFIRIFKDKTGYTPIDYYIRLKIQKACELLESSTLKIKDISSLLGFETPYYFSIAFKKIMNYSPSKYRKITGR